MTTCLLTRGFPTQWLWGQYEQTFLATIKNQVDQHFAKQRNLIINMTWFGPQFPEQAWNEYLAQYHGTTWDNVFLVAMVDPPMMNHDQIQDLTRDLGGAKVFALGNFDTDWHFNFFAPVLSRHFQKYQDAEIMPTQFDFVYINYNRKPRRHRVALVRMLQQRQLQQHGIITLGRPNRIYDDDPDNDIFLTIGEDPEQYHEQGHWFSGTDEFGIPHDVLSLHRIDLWQRHFLYIVSATEFNTWDPLFVSETQFKPMLGLRPFVINGNVRTYQWLQDNGFKNFENFWSDVSLRDDDAVHENICRLVQRLSEMSREDLHRLYHSMMPDLLHNRNRFSQFAQEQAWRIDNIFCTAS